MISTYLNIQCIIKFHILQNLQGTMHIYAMHIYTMQNNAIFFKCFFCNSLGSTNSISIIIIENDL